MLDHQLSWDLCLLAVGASLWIWIITPKETKPLLFSPSLPSLHAFMFLSPFVLVCFSYLCKCCACLFCVGVACPPSRSPWWKEGGVAQVLPIVRHLKLLHVLLDPSFSLMFYNLHFCHHNCMYCDFSVVDLVCTHICCMSVCPGVRPLFLFLKFLPCFPYPN